MPVDSATLQEARAEGYSDAEIYRHLAQIDPRYAEAQKHGYALDDIAKFSDAQKPKYKYAESEAGTKAPEANAEGRGGGIGQPIANAIEPVIDSELAKKAANADTGIIGAATPVGSAQTILKGLQGKPTSPLQYGASAADLASLPVAGALGAGKKAIGQLAAQGAGAGAASYGAKMAGAPWYLQVLAGLAGGGAGNMAAGAGQRLIRQLVPKGEEAEALAKVARGPMGLPVGEVASNAPADVKNAFGGARDLLGKNVAAAKQGLYDSTRKSTPEIVDAISGAADKGLGDAGVPLGPVGSNTRVPELSNNPETAKLIAGRIGGYLKHMDPSTPPAKAMEFSNNIIEGLQKELAGSYKPGAAANLDAPMLKITTKGMNEALNGLASPEAQLASHVADSAFSKIAWLDKAARDASKTRVGPTPAFNPRLFTNTWANMSPALKNAKF